MPNVTEGLPGTDMIRAVISDFLQARLQPKLDKLKNGEEEKRQKLLEAHQPKAWIADAARRVDQIQQVTHALKFTHPDAKGTSLSSPGNPHVGELMVGTHTLDGEYPPDVVGNAAALDVYKFLRLEVGGKTLLSLAAANDERLRDALSGDVQEAKEWMESFASLTESKGAPASHKQAKQLYWPLGGQDYHLLAPLFPTSLVHGIWQGIREDRFSDEAKAARKAHDEKQDHPHGYREYPNLLVQKFGGTKPQNISQLNSERYGENYLLPSLPPNWRSEAVKPPLGVESVFDGRFGSRQRVRELLNTLSAFLYSVKDAKSNIRIRNKRKELVGYIVDELLLFADELRELEESWTLRDECRLNSHEQCWLNPVRAAEDEVFAASYILGEWKAAVCQRFANWLNARLRHGKQSLHFDDAAQQQWKHDLDKKLRMLRTEVSAYE